MSTVEPRSHFDPDVIYLRADILGLRLALRCRGCGARFERYQPTVAGVPLGVHRCPQCGASHEMGPAHFRAAIERLLPITDLGVLSDMTNEATRVAESWHRVPVLSSCLEHRGVELGPPTERELLAFITEGLLLISQGKKARP